MIEQEQSRMNEDARRRHKQPKRLYGKVHAVDPVWTLDINDDDDEHTGTNEDEETKQTVEDV